MAATGGRLFTLDDVHEFGMNLCRLDLCGQSRGHDLE
jgi:hypothetical protein